jgi:hypothetical protein
MARRKHLEKQIVVLLPPAKMSNESSDIWQLPTEVVVQLVAHVVDELLLERSPMDKGASNKFTAERPPPISVAAYLARLAAYLPLHNDSIVIALLFFRRIILNPRQSCSCPTSHYLNAKSHRPPLLNAWTVHRLVFSCCIVASKVSWDYCRRIRLTLVSVLK